MDDTFDESIRRRNLLGYWMLSTTSDRDREPMPSYRPFLWDWATVREAIYEASVCVPKEQAYRRFIGMKHPDLQTGTAPNYFLGCQLILAGESAPAHRHTMDAVRLVIEGDGSTCTVVDGEPFPMHRWDVITTPNFSWHDHVSTGSSDTIWVDAAVSPLIRHFGVGFAEVFPQTRQPLRHEAGWSRTAQAQPSPQARRLAYRFAWQDTRRALDVAGLSPDPCDDSVVPLKDPRDGGFTLDTLNCEMVRLRPGWQGRSHRHVHATTYHVLSGSGSTRVGDQTLTWKEGDTFVVPIWTWHAHTNSSHGECLLFSADDLPLHRALGFERWEVAQP
jgi:1-hydroxy-2-naphthoate dioxygenase